MRLYERINHEMEEETQHADVILRRVLFLGGKPDMRPHAFTPGDTVEDMLRKDLAVEYQVRDNLRAPWCCAKSTRTFSPVTCCWHNSRTRKKTMPTGWKSS